MALPRSRGNKPKASLPPHYYEGFLEKKTPLEKDYKRYWTGLRGVTLYFYNTSRDSQYVEKVDLSDFVSLTDDPSPKTVATWNADGMRVNLKLKHQEVILKMESLESREMWKGFILTVVEMKIPSSLTLLPGHIYMLSEALEKETERRSRLGLADPKGGAHDSTAGVGRSFPPAREENKELPECFFRVSRTEAEVLLEKNEKSGNMLLRPGGDGKSVAVTTRQVANGTIITKHYKINMVAGEYVIDIEDPYRCSSLADVVEFFVTHSKMLLVPLILDESYSVSLEVVDTDQESGESTPMRPWLPAALLPAPKAGVLGRPAIAPPPLPPIALVPPLPAPNATLENVYEEEDQPDQTYMNDKAGSCCIQPGGVRVIWRDRTPAAQTPPTPPGKLPKSDVKGIPAGTAPYHSPSQRRLSHGPSSLPVASIPGRIATGLSEELAQKLKERRATLED